MLGTILDMFVQIINWLRSVIINIGGFNVSLFTLFVGIFVFATLCRTYLKYILDLPTNVNVAAHHSLSEFINSNGEIYKVIKSRWY